MVSKVAESNISMYRQSKSAIYHLLDSHKFENHGIPINTNTLIFKEKPVEYQYHKDLYLDEKQAGLSEEFKLILTYFYTIMTLILICLIGFSVLLYANSLYDSAEFFINLASLLFLLAIFYIFLGLLIKWFNLVMAIKNFFTIFAFLLNTYLILCNSSVLSTFIHSEFTKSSLPLTLVLLVSMSLIRSLLFDDFFRYLLLVIYAVILFITINIAFSQVNLYANLCECAIIGLFLCYQLIECHINCIRSKIIFWRKYSEEKAAEMNGECDQDLGITFETEGEHIIFICEEIKKEIKSAIKVIIFQDIKQRLKETLANVNKIRKIIGHCRFEAPISMGQVVNDLEDREFIAQNYQDPSPLALGSEGLKRNSTFISAFEYKVNSLFPGNFIERLSNLLEGIGKNWCFDIWLIHETTGRSISIIGQYLFSKFSLCKRFNIKESVLEKFLHSLETGYSSQPYHNACHGADVMHTLMYFVMNSELHKTLTPIETLALIIAGLGHDIGHPGVNTRYLIQTRDPLAIQFNDLSVLENMHCAKIYQYLANPGENIFEWLSTEDWNCSRKVIIEMIMATDMSKHFDLIGRFRTRAVTLADLNMDSFEDKLLVYSTALKAADIGHSAKHTDLHQKWTRLVMEEFFKQGDMEKAKNLPVSMYCDRLTANLPKSQSGFLKNVCMPLYEVWCKYINTEAVNRTLEELKKNIEYWESGLKARRSTQPPLEIIVPIKPKGSFGGS